MRLAHLILAHQDPQQLERLAKRLMHEDADIYIHLDKKQDTEAYSSVQSVPNVSFIKNNVSVTWANYSMMTATLNSMEEILATGIKYSHINLLSGADYPLKSPVEIQQFLFTHTEQTFMRYKNIYKSWQETASRFDMYSLGDYNIPAKFMLQGLLNRFLPKRKLPNGLIAYGFSQWFTITPVCAQYVIDYLKKNTAVRRFFRLTWGVDELVFQTILLNSHLRDKVVNDHLRYIKFKDRASSPETITIADKNALTSSGKFYARKFNPEIDTEIMDYLDKVQDSTAANK